MQMKFQLKWMSSSLRVGNVFKRNYWHWQMYIINDYLHQRCLGYLHTNAPTIGCKIKVETASAYHTKSMRRNLLFFPVLHGKEAFSEV